MANSSACQPPTLPQGQVLNCTNPDACTLTCDPTNFFLNGPAVFPCAALGGSHCVAWWSREMSGGVAIGFVLMLCTIIFFMRPKPRPAENVAVGYVVFSVLSFSFDVYFIYFIWLYMPHSSRHTLALVGLLIPLVGSFFFVPYILIREYRRHANFQTWIKEHPIAFVFAVFFSFICCDNFVLWACGLLGRAAFCAPLKRARALRMAGLVLTFIGGIIRLSSTLQYFIETGTFVNPAGPSLVFTGMCILSRLSICKCWREVDSPDTPTQEAQPTAPVIDPIVLLHTRRQGGGDRPAYFNRQIFLNNFRKNSVPMTNHAIEPISQPSSGVTTPHPPYSRINSTPGSTEDREVSDVYGTYLSLDRIEPASPQLLRQNSSQQRPMMSRTPTHGPTGTFTTTMPQSQFKEIDFNELKFLQEVGRGHFNTVFSVLWRGGIIAGKRPNQAVTLDEFIDELYIHQLLGNHPHVVKFVGACTMEPNLCILLELMPQKSIEELLVKGGKFSEERDFPIIAQMCVDAAAGLLHMHREGVIHRDVAARNFLVNAQNRVTICDFGLSKQLKRMLPDGSSIIGRTGTLLGPIKWMAPELLTEEIDPIDKKRYQSFNEQTDVYMFGVFLWEVMARSEPYPGLTDHKAAHFIAHDNGSPDVSMCRCPKQYKDLISQCLSRDPAFRPTMDIVANTLREFFDDIKAKSDKLLEKQPSGSGHGSNSLQPTPLKGQQSSGKFFGDELHVPFKHHSPSDSLSNSREGSTLGPDGGGSGGSSTNLHNPSFGYTKIDIVKGDLSDNDNNNDPTVFLHLPGQMTRDQVELSGTPPGETLVFHNPHSASIGPGGDLGTSSVTNYIALS